MLHVTGKYNFTVDHAKLNVEGAGYVGKLRSNLFGSQYRLYDDGEDPGLFSSPVKLREELLAVNYVPCP